MSSEDDIIKDNCISNESKNLKSPENFLNWRSDENDVTAMKKQRIDYEIS